MEKSFIEYAEEVEQEFDMGGITSGIYRKVWLEAFARWQAAQQSVQADTKACEQTFHQLMKLQGKSFCCDCGVRL